MVRFGLSRRDNGGKLAVDEKKSLKISWYILLASMSVLTILFFFDIKFMVAGLNIIAWDMLAGGIWIFVNCPNGLGVKIRKKGRSP